MTLRGSILEDAVASTGRHGTVRGLSLKEVLEQVVPELNVACLRLALSTPKVTEQLLKLEEQGVSLVSVCSCIYFLSMCNKTGKWAVNPNSYDDASTQLCLDEIQKMQLDSQSVLVFSPRLLEEKDKRHNCSV